MRLAQITYSYKPVTGGADVYADLLRGVCEDLGYEVMVYQRPTEGVNDSGVRMVRSPLAPILGRRGEFWTLPLGLLALRRTMASFDVLVVHYPNFHRFVEWHARTILVSHGVFWDDRPGGLRSRIKRAVARRAFRRAWRVVANDTFYLREMGVAVEPGAEPFTEVLPGRFFIPNCVDVARFSRVAPHAALTDWPVILVPRNLYWNRGVHLAIEAFALCAGELPGARLVVVGADGQRGYREHCQALARKHGLAERVIFFGPVPWEQMPAVYSASALTVIPTLCGEGTSLSALESMSCGTATVTTNVAGLADLPAVRCEPAPAALASAMVEAWRDRETIAAQQQQTVRDTFNLERWRAAWERVLSP